MTCSDTLSMSSSGAPAQKYLACPVSPAVCGETRNVQVELPNLIDNLLYTKPVIKSKELPPGYVCSYTINLD